MDTLGYDSLFIQPLQSECPVEFLRKVPTVVPLADGSLAFSAKDVDSGTGDTSKAYLYYDLTTQQLVTIYSNVAETSTLKRVYLAG